MRVVCVLLLNDTEVTQVAEACLRFTPQVAVGERAIFLEISGCRRLYSEDSLKIRLQILMRRLAVKYRLALAGDIPTSLAMVMFRKNHRDRLPIEALQIYASPFRHSDSMFKVIGIFKRLGIETLHALKQMPREKLTARFSKDAWLAIHHIDTAAQTPWRRFVVPERILEFSDIDESYAIREFEPILFVLRGLLDRAFLRLRGRGELASVIEVRLEQERYSTVAEPVRKWRLEFAFPQGAMIAVLAMLREKIQMSLAQEPLAAPVRRVEIEILNAVASRGRQTDFFSRKEEELESVRTIVARLTEKLGQSRAFFASPQASYTPEKNWTKSLEPTSTIKSIPLAERPLRVLPQALALRRIDHFFIYKQKRWRILEMNGPERLGGEWWWHEQERDYYRVRVDSGEEFWIFENPQTHDYFLHGVFD